MQSARACRSTAVLFGIFAVGVMAQRGLMQPARRSGPFWPFEASSARPIDHRFGFDAVQLVAYPDPHASVKERLHPGIDLAVVEQLENALEICHAASVSPFTTLVRVQPVTRRGLWAALHCGGLLSCSGSSLAGAIDMPISRMIWATAARRSSSLQPALVKNTDTPLASFISIE
jgi:hypothetical protein